MNLLEIAENAVNVVSKEEANKWMFHFEMKGLPVMLIVTAKTRIFPGSQPYTSFSYVLHAGSDKEMVASGDIIKTKDGGGNWDDAFAAVHELQERAEICRKTSVSVLYQHINDATGGRL